MAICNNFQNEQTDELVEASLRGENSGIQSCSPEIQAQIERNMPAVIEAHNARSLELLGENSDNARAKNEEQIAQKGDMATDLDRLARDNWPTHQQLCEMVVIGEKLGVSDTDIISFPLICATPNVKGVEELTHDMMWAIQNQDKIPYWHKDDAVFPKIIFVEKSEMGITATKRAEFDPVTKVLFVYQKADGKFPTKEELKDEILPHEIPHASEEFKIKIGNHIDELKAIVVIEQTFARASGKGDISLYVEELGKLYREGKISEGRLAEEWVSECCRRYATGKCSETTREFFDKLFSK